MYKVTYVDENIKHVSRTKYFKAANWRLANLLYSRSKTYDRAYLQDEDGVVRSEIVQTDYGRRKFDLYATVRIEYENIPRLYTVFELDKYGNATISDVDINRDKFYKRIPLKHLIVQR